MTACGNSRPRDTEKSGIALSLDLEALIIKQNGIWVVVENQNRQKVPDRFL